MPVSTRLEEMENNYISKEVAFFILSKLPIKSVARFQCVNKAWSHLLKNSYFMTMYGNNFTNSLSKSSSYDDDTSLLLNLHSGKLHSLSGYMFEDRAEFYWPFLSPYRNFNRIDLFGFNSVNGILCLHGSPNNMIVLWNPTTEEFKAIPLTPPKSFLPYIASHIKHDVEFGAHVKIHGFGYDCVKDDYKIICHARLTSYYLGDLHRNHFGPAKNDPLWMQDESFKPFWEIYSLRSNSWRKLDVDMPRSSSDLVATCNGNHQVYMEGVCHWLCSYHKSIETLVGRLVSFNLNSEKFCITLVPSNIILGWTQLAVLNGSIALISFPPTMKTFHISILGEVGAKESWVKVVVVERPCVGIPVGVGMKGEIFFIKEDNELILFDLNTKMIVELGLKGKGKAIRHQIKVYKKNFLPIRRIIFK